MFFPRVLSCHFPEQLPPTLYAGQLCWNETIENAKQQQILSLKWTTWAICN